MRMTRREWIVTGAAAVAAAVAGGGAKAAEPKKPVPLPKLSLAGYSFRDYLPHDGKPGKITLQDFFGLAADYGLQAAEPTGYYFTSEDFGYVHSLKASAHRLGVDISGTAIRNDFCDPDPAKRKADVAYVKRWVDVALHLGAPHIRVFAGNPHAGVSDEQATAWAIESLRECADYAGTQGIYLGIENHGYLTTSGDKLMEVAGAIDNPWLGINLDTGNFDSDPYENIARAVPRAANVQLKLDVAGDKPKSKVPADFARIFKILRDGGYRGYVALEYEGKDDPYTGVPKFIDEARKGLEAAALA